MAWYILTPLHWGQTPEAERSYTLQKNIGWRVQYGLNSSILYHILMQKDRCLCIEQVTSKNGHHGRLTSNPHWPCECTCYEADSHIKLKSSTTRHLPEFRWIKILLSMLSMWDIYALSCMSKVQEKYKIYLKYYHICTKYFLMHIEIEVRVMKSKVWALKNHQLNARGRAWTSETEECTYRSTLVTENWLANSIKPFLRIHSQLMMI